MRSVFTATRRTSILDGSSFSGPITWKSILTSLMSKGMYFSTSHWIYSSSSSGVLDAHRLAMGELDGARPDVQPDQLLRSEQRHGPTILLVFPAEHLVPVRQLKSQGQDDLPLGIHAARHPLLHPVDGQHRQSGAPCQLRLAHQEPLPDLSDIVRLDFIPDLHCLHPHVLWCAAHRKIGPEQPRLQQMVPCPKLMSSDF